MKRQRKVNNIFFRKANFLHIRKLFLGILGRLEGMPLGVKVCITLGSREEKKKLHLYPTYWKTDIARKYIELKLIILYTASSKESINTNVVAQNTQRAYV